MQIFKNHHNHILPHPVKQFFSVSYEILPNLLQHSSSGPHNPTLKNIIFFTSHIALGVKTTVSHIDSSSSILNEPDYQNLMAIL